MGPFAEMAAVLADSVLGAPATWSSRNTAEEAAVRVVLSRPEAPVGGFGGKAAAVLAMIPTAGLPRRPERGDGLTVAGARYLVESIEASPTGASWSCTLILAP